MMFVSSSLFEGMSNSMLEAMSIGLPVVCTDCYGGGASAVIRDGENGLLVPVENAAALAEAMMRIARDPSLANRLSENAVRIKDTLAKEKICRLWHKTFAEISDM
jgi:glycosyltransferase involved in cell wall biosynthesis